MQSPELHRDVTPQAGDIFKSTLDADFFDSLEQRVAGELSAETGCEKQKEAVKRILRESGVGDIAKSLARGIQIISVPEGLKYGGGYNRNTGDIRLYADPRYLRRLLPVILHELGHGLEQKIALAKDVPELLNAYLGIVQAESTAHSPYAEAYGVRLGRQDKDYILESFAEDFRLFWLNPGSLSDAKRLILRELVASSLETIDVNAAQEQIAKFITENMGTSADQLVDELNDQTLSEALVKLDTHLAHAC